MNRKNICKYNNKRMIGMTLIELLIVVVVIGVLSSIAYPSYQSHALKSHRNLAKSDMLKLQLLLEDQYNSGYSWSNLISSGACTVCESSDERYTFSITSSASQSYVITATAQSGKGQASDECLPNNNQMTLASNGEVTPSECW